MPTVKANGITIEYEGHGSGAPLLLIAGIGYDRWMWHRMIPGLAEDFRVIAFDNRGVGGSDKPPGPYTAELLADDAAALLEALGVEKAAIYGHSMGGFIAQALVLEHGQQVDKLILSATNFGGSRHIPSTPEAWRVLTDTGGDPIERLRRGIAVSTASGFSENHPELVEEWIGYRVAHPVQPAAYQAQLAIGLALVSDEASFDHKLHHIEAPTLILFGEHDEVVPPGNAALLAEQIPNSTIAILPGVGHFYPLEAPDAAVSAVARFLQS
jgi:pimeloyl-ACP methyl ester carboxylesterase